MWKTPVGKTPVWKTSVARTTRPLFGADTVRGWGYALAGAAWSLPPAAVALAVAAGAGRSWPAVLRWVCFGAVFVALLLVGGRRAGCGRGVCA
ncbi:histidine kinase, partial [Streptomyces sparsogenes DSM 40356]